MNRNTKPSQIDKVLEIIKEIGIIRPRDLDPYGIPREYLRRLKNRGLLIHLGRGIYTSHDANLTEHHSFAEACTLVPHGTICLLSALRFHGLTTQAPPKVWMAIDVKARRPKTSTPLHIVRFSGKSLKSGIETHKIQGVPVKVYNPAKTVADCFKYRNKIGLDVALEALQDCWRNRRCTIDELWHYAKICRVANVMRPYMESLP